MPTEYIIAPDPETQPANDLLPGPVPSEDDLDFRAAYGRAKLLVAQMNLFGF
jgi:hypothetical protein